MKKLLLLALAPVAPSALAQVQQPVTGHIDLIGEAPAACLVKAPAGSDGSNASFEPLSAGAGRIRIEQLADLADATPRSAAIRVELPVICNSPHRVVLRSGNGGLRREGAAAAAPTGPFREFLPYRLGISWGGDQAERNSDAGTPLVIGTNAARSGEMTVLFSLASGGMPLVAGTYSDEIILEVQIAD